MGQHLRLSELVPRGFVVDEVIDEVVGIQICIRAAGATSCRPGCRTTSTRVHSRYARQLAHLPLSGRSVRLVIRARRFHRDAVLCPRRIFAERFDAEVLAPWSRRTARLDYIVRSRSLAGTRELKPRGRVRPRREKGSRRRRRGHHVSLVQRPDRGPDHEAQAGEAPDVRSRETRSARGAPRRHSIRPHHQICVRADIPRLSGGRSNAV